MAGSPIFTGFCRTGGLHIIDEAFVRVHINVLGCRAPSWRTSARQSRIWCCCRNAGLSCVRTTSPAGSAPITRGPRADVADAGDKHVAALASELAGEIYGLDVLARHVEDNGDNTTRFLIMSPEPDYRRRGAHNMITSFVFQVRNIPAALYKAMGGFATNGINMTKLESYMVDGSFTATQFYADIDGHPDDPHVQLALDELNYFTTNVEILGVYPADNGRF